MKLLSIGQFASLVGLSVSALRFYADSGILLPAQIDQDSGYRYYTPEQIPLGQRVADLRKLDLPLNELNDLLSGSPEQATTILERHERRLVEQFQRKRELLLEVGELLNGRRVLPSVEVRYRRWPSQHVLSLTMNAEAESFNTQYRQSVWALHQHAQTAGVRVQGMDFGLYHAQEYFSGPLQTEVCLPVAEPLGGQGRIRFMTLPDTPVVCALHRDDWRTFSATYAAIYLVASQDGYQPGSSYTLDTPDGTELGFLLT
ncbi:hypothetical protein Dcar01_02865 [Deinococcus carri]|uniref:HTH merR-type domain-containing protein n=1 Tax=Deinococcus carri TaxID=1211323 RepID=A0ABP9WBZ6_9DEIO